MQLENGISEIESKQGKQLHASHPPGVSKEFIFQYQQDQETAEGVLRTGSFALEGDHLCPFTSWLDCHWTTLILGVVSSSSGQVEQKWMAL